MCQILLKKYIQRTNYDMAALVQPIKVSASLYTAMYIPDTSVLPVTVPLAMNEVLIPDTWNPLIMKNGDVTVASLAASERKTGSKVGGWKPFGYLFIVFSTLCSFLSKASHSCILLFSEAFLREDYLDQIR